MNVFGYYVYNASRDRWLAYDEKSWGPFGDAQEFFDRETAEAIRERETKNDEATYVMACLQ